MRSHWCNRYVDKMDGSPSPGPPSLEEMLCQGERRVASTVHGLRYLDTIFKESAEVDEVPDLCDARLWRRW